MALATSAKPIIRHTAPTGAQSSCRIGNITLDARASTVYMLHKKIVPKERAASCPNEMLALPLERVYAMRTCPYDIILLMGEPFNTLHTAE